MIIFASDFTLVLPICVQSYKKNIREQIKKQKLIDGIQTNYTTRNNDISDS